MLKVLYYSYENLMKITIVNDNGNHKKRNISKSKMSRCIMAIMREKLFKSHENNFTMSYNMAVFFMQILFCIYFSFAFRGKCGVGLFSERFTKGCVFPSLQLMVERSPVKMNQVDYPLRWVI